MAWPNNSLSTLSPPVKVCTNQRERVELNSTARSGQRRGDIEITGYLANALGPWHLGPWHVVVHFAMTQTRRQFGLNNWAC
jgi:hypothetical protein